MPFDLLELSRIHAELAVDWGLERARCQRVDANAAILQLG